MDLKDRQWIMIGKWRHTLLFKRLGSVKIDYTAALLDPVSINKWSKKLKLLSPHLSYKMTMQAERYAGLWYMHNGLMMAI
jgi:hypothetical protein